MLPFRTRHRTHMLATAACLWVCLQVCPIRAWADTYPLTEDIIGDIYEYLTETAAVDYEELQEDLMDAAAHPVNLNTATAADLERLRFLTDQQVDAILLYVYEHPMQDIAELQLIPCLEDYTIRDLRAFVYAAPAPKDNRLNIKEVFRSARHELTLRLDTRNIENYTNDPVFVHTRYRFHYLNRVQFGLTLKRPAGGTAQEMQYAGYLQLNDMGCFRTIVAGDFQASFGQGLVLANAFHTGRTAYIMAVGNSEDGLRKYGSTEGNGLHGVGATAAFGKGKIKTEISALYSLQLPSDTMRHHVLGANLTMRYKRLKWGLTAVENLYSDTLRPYRDMAYNAHYFRGTRQAVMGLNMRYNYGLFDLFGEVATAQNTHWGIGAVVGSRIVPTQGIGLVLLYRYYSPWFDNTLGYAYSETSRINDENGGYIGLEITRLQHWRWSLSGDVFRFDGVKYGIPYSPSWGYDAIAETAYTPNDRWQMVLRLRAREKAKRGTYSARYRFDWGDGHWRLRTQAEANLVADSLQSLSWGLSVYQDIQYTFAQVPLTLQVRLQGFDTRNWNNRIYTYENDVLYGYANTFVYGQGGRAYLNLRWQIIKQLGLYLRLSETVYCRNWVTAHELTAATRTDIHLLLRATL